MSQKTDFGNALLRTEACDMLEQAKEGVLPEAKKEILLSSLEMDFASRKDWEDRSKIEQCNRVISEAENLANLTKELAEVAETLDLQIPANQEFLVNLSKNLEKHAASFDQMSLDIGSMVPQLQNGLIGSPQFKAQVIDKYDVGALMAATNPSNIVEQVSQYRTAAVSRLNNLAEALHPEGRPVNSGEGQRLWQGQQPTPVIHPKYDELLDLTAQLADNLQIYSDRLEIKGADDIKWDRRIRRTAMKTSSKKISELVSEITDSPSYEAFKGEAAVKDFIRSVGEALSQYLPKEGRSSSFTQTLLRIAPGQTNSHIKERLENLAKEIDPRNKDLPK